MKSASCILTTNDKTFLRSMCRSRHLSAAVASLLQIKLRSAITVSTDELPSNVATIDSRVSYNFNFRPAGTKIISRNENRYPSGYALPVNTIRGLALVGMAEGQSIEVQNASGGTDVIQLKAVEYQPQLARHWH